jgi:hypothetical protein
LETHAQLTESSSCTYRILVRNSIGIILPNSLPLRSRSHSLLKTTELLSFLRFVVISLIVAPLDPIYAPGLVLSSAEQVGLFSIHRALHKGGRLLACAAAMRSVLAWAVLSSISSAVIAAPPAQEDTSQIVSQNADKVADPGAAVAGAAGEDEGVGYTVFNDIKVPQMKDIDGGKFNETIKDGYW